MTTEATPSLRLPVTAAPLSLWPPPHCWPHLSLWPPLNCGPPHCGPIPSVPSLRLPTHCGPPYFTYYINYNIYYNFTIYIWVVLFTLFKYIVKYFNNASVREASIQWPPPQRGFLSLRPLSLWRPPHCRTPSLWSPSLWPTLTGGPLTKNNILIKLYILLILIYIILVLYIDYFIMLLSILIKCWQERPPNSGRPSLRPPLKLARLAGVTPHCGPPSL